MDIIYVKKNYNSGLLMLMHRGSYMSAYVLLNLLNNLRKSDQIRCFPSILSLFHNNFNKFNKTRARMVDSIYHMTLKLPKITFLVWKLQDFAIFYAMF